MKKNEFLNLVSSPLMNLDHTYRYSGTKLAEAESLSHHIVDCIMLGLKIIDNIKSRSPEEQIDERIYVMKAVYHDLEEVITGDIPRPLKYYNEDTLSSMREVADSVAQKFFEREFHSPMREMSYILWNNSKEDVEGFILKLVDNLVVVNKVVKEVSLLHNYYMLRVAHEVSQYTELIKENVINNPHFVKISANQYILDVLDGAISSMKKILEDHKDIMDSLDIYGQSMI